MVSPCGGTYEPPGGRSEREPEHYSWLQRLCKASLIAWWIIAVPIQFILPFHKVRMYFTF